MLAVLRGEAGAPSDLRDRALLLAGEVLELGDAAAKGTGMLFRSTPPVFRTGWFVESLLTQTLVLFVIRTSGNPFRSRPSSLLTITVCAAVFVGLVIPYLPIAGVLGFVPPPPAFMLFVAVTTAAYLTAVELTKRRLVPELMDEHEVD